MEDERETRLQKHIKITAKKISQKNMTGKLDNRNKEKQR
jgi:hypothetical protein